jgi:RHS repeat-associated protein
VIPEKYSNILGNLRLYVNILTKKPNGEGWIEGDAYPVVPRPKPNITTGRVNVINDVELMTETGSLRFVVGLKALASGYDANGNMTLRLKDGARYFLSYDAESRLTSVSGTVSASFAYNGDGQRVTATIDTTITTYIGGHFEWQNGVGKSYYFAGAQRVAMRTSTEVKFLLGDHLGSTSVTALANGAFDTETRYYAWGEVRWSSGTAPTDYRFTGQMEVGYINLYWYGSRWYDPALGRFASPDTIIPQQQGTQAFDRYAYANNSPTRYTDPSGHGAYCGDDYDPGCLSDDEMPKYYRAVRHRTGVDLNTHHSPDQFAPEIVDAYGNNACGIVAASAAGADASDIATAMGDDYDNEFGIQPGDYAEALNEVYGDDNVTAGSTTLAEVTEALDKGQIVIVDFLLSIGDAYVAHFARVLGIDWGEEEIYIEDTLGEGGTYWAFSFDEFDTDYWNNPEGRATNRPKTYDTVYNWAVFITLQE